ncbi:MAG: hypothetical protein ABEJ78_00980 [Haloferacaceae archaeon]
MDAVRVAPVAAFLAGLVVGGVAVGASVPRDGGVDPAHPPYSVASASGCIDDAGGWAFTTPVERGQMVVVNLTVDHGPGASVESDLVRVGDGRYRFDVTTVSTEKRGAPDCRTGSTVEFSGTLPAAVEAVTVVYDGRRVGTVRPTDGPTYRPL